VAHYRLSPTSSIPAGLTITKVEVDTAGVTFDNVRVSNLACAPAIPEVPLAAVYPLLGVATLGAGYAFLRRGRSTAAS